MVFQRKSVAPVLQFGKIKGARSPSALQERRGQSERPGLLAERHRLRFAENPPLPLKTKKRMAARKALAKLTSGLKG